MSHTRGQYVFVNDVVNRVGSRGAFPVWKRTELPIPTNFRIFVPTGVKNRNAGAASLVTVYRTNVLLAPERASRERKGARRWQGDRRRSTRRCCGLSCARSG